MLRREQLVPNSHALRLIKRSAARHKVCKARHASSWNSRPVTPKKKFRVRKNETKRFGNKQTTSNQNNNNNNNQSTQPHSNTNNAMTKIQRARKKKPPSFEEMLRSEIPLRRQNKSNNNHNQNTNQNNKKNNNCHNKKTSSRRISTSAYTRSTQNGRIKNKRGGGGGSWTRSGMKMTTGPSRAKVANIRRKTQRPELRAKSAPSSDNKRANSRTRARTSNNSHRHRSNNQENMSENMSENISENISENMSENICISENQKTTNALLAETEQDPLATTHHNFGTIDTTLLDTKRPTGEEETPGGMWGDGVGLDLSTILECSVESQSVASFLSPASQKLMQAHLRTRSRKDDHSVGDSNDTSEDDMDTNTSNIRRSSSFTSGMTTINEQISPEELAGGWRVFHQEAEEEATVNQAEYTEEEEEDTEEDKDDNENNENNENNESGEVENNRFYEQDQEVEMGEEAVVDESIAVSPQYSEPSSILDELEDVSNTDTINSNDEYDEYDEDSFAEDEEYLDDSFVEDEETIQEIAVDLKALSTLAPGDFSSLLNVLRE